MCTLNTTKQNVSVQHRPDIVKERVLFLGTNLHTNHLVSILFSVRFIRSLSTRGILKFFFKKPLSTCQPFEYTCLFLNASLFVYVLGSGFRCVSGRGACVKIHGKRVGNVVFFFYIKS